MKKLIILLAFVLAGCVANSSITPMGKNTYMVSRQAATGFPGLGNLKAEAMTEAFQHCQAEKKDMEVIQTSESQPPFILGNYPRAEVQFRCI